MTDLVSGSSSEVVVGERSTWGGGVEDVASIRAVEKDTISNCCFELWWDEILCWGTY